MRFFLSFLLLVGLCGGSRAAEITSAYTDLSPEKDCVTIAAAEEGEGDWSSMVCAGYRGYPVIIESGDLRDSVFYGFPPSGEPGIVWESFSAFNSPGPKIEWRIETKGAVAVPFAVIQRWFVSDPEDAEKKTEVLAIEKVGQLDKRDGCTVGLVVATGNPKANETARRIADEQARDFACGGDERVLVSGEVPLPEFSRTEN